MANQTPRVVKKTSSARSADPTSGLDRDATFTSTSLGPTCGTKETTHDAPRVAKKDAKAGPKATASDPRADAPAVQAPSAQASHDDTHATDSLRSKTGAGGENNEQHGDDAWGHFVVFTPPQRQHEIVHER